MAKLTAQFPLNVGARAKIESTILSISDLFYSSKPIQTIDTDTTRTLHFNLDSLNSQVAEQLYDALNSLPFVEAKLENDGNQ